MSKKCPETMVCLWEYLGSKNIYREIVGVNLDDYPLRLTKSSKYYFAKTSSTFVKLSAPVQRKTKDAVDNTIMELFFTYSTKTNSVWANINIQLQTQETRR
jgi:hypothetical protein